MICVRTWKKVTSSDFNSWEEWTQFVNDNYKHCREKSTLNDYKGKCSVTDLPAEHPYWTKVVRESVLKTMKRHIRNYIECSKDPSKIKYLYNANASLRDVRDKINKCKTRINEYDKYIRED